MSAIIYLKSSATLLLVKQLVQSYIKLIKENIKKKSKHCTSSLLWGKFTTDDNIVSPGCGRSRRSPDLVVSIAPGRRAEILIAVTAGGYCLTRLCSRGGHTTCREAKQLTNTIPLSSAKPPASKTRFSRVNCMPGTHFIELFVFVAFADTEHIFRQLP